MLNNNKHSRVVPSLFTVKLRNGSHVYGKNFSLPSKGLCYMEDTVCNHLSSRKGQERGGRCTTTMRRTEGASILTGTLIKTYDPTPVGLYIVMTDLDHTLRGRGEEE